MKPIVEGKARRWAERIPVWRTAARLSVEERAELAVFLLDGLDEVPHHVSDEEVLRRRDELASGKVTGMSRDEFRKARGR